MGVAEVCDMTHGWLSWLRCVLVATEAFHWVMTGEMISPPVKVITIVKGLSSCPLHLALYGVTTIPMVKWKTLSYPHSRVCLLDSVTVTVSLLCDAWLISSSENDLCRHQICSFQAYASLWKCVFSSCINESDIRRNTVIHNKTPGAAFMKPTYQVCIQLPWQSML